MARSKKARKRARASFDTLPDAVQKHILSLQLNTVEEYFDWCREHGFAERTTKSRTQMRDERTHVVRTKIQCRVATSRRDNRPERQLRRVLDGDRRNVPSLLRPIAAFFDDDRNTVACRDYARALLRHVDAVCPTLLWGRTDASEQLYVNAVLRLAEHHERARRDFSTWRERTHNDARRFASLARHVYADWPVPGFLDSAWLGGTETHRLGRDWFVHVGAGHNLRTAESPVPMTRKIAHHVLQAPDDFSIVAAVRWGQVHGLGGDARLARELRGTRLGHEFGNEDFWRTVIDFFVRNPMLDPTHAGPVIDFVHHHRFRTERIVDGDGRQRVLPPPQPNLTMRGRTAESLLTQVDRWHGNLAHSQRGAAKLTWARSGFLPFRYESRDRHGRVRAVYHVQELTTGAQLIQEGSKMRHCVATYARSCASGIVSIWSLDRSTSGNADRLLTIEVRNANARIVQARGKANARPTPEARGVMLRWAQAANLSISDWV